MEKQSIDQIDSTLVKMILNSIKEGDIATIKNNIIKYSIDIKVLRDNEMDHNAFFFAALIKDDNNALEIFKYLKELGVDPLSKDKHHQTCLYYCCREGKYETCKYLIEECSLPINERDIYGQHPIYYAARDGRGLICELLIEKGADVNLEDKYGQTCLFYAIRENHYEIVDFLIKHNADVNKIDKKKQMPLIYAEKLGKTTIVELLNQNGAIKPETKKKKGKTEKKQSQIESQVIDSTEARQELIMSIQKPKKNVLVKIMPNGEKVPLTNEEMKQFLADYPEVNELLYNKELQEKMTNECDEELQLHDSWEKNAKKLMGQVWKHRDAEIFHRPVDPIELRLPDYFDKIKKPMDFGTMKQKLNIFQYRNCKEFCEDMELVFNNCYEYNGEKTHVGNMCTNVKAEYTKAFNQLGMNKFI